MQALAKKVWRKVLSENTGKLDAVLNGQIATRIIPNLATYFQFSMHTASKLHQQSSKGPCTKNCGLSN